MSGRNLGSEKEEVEKEVSKIGSFFGEVGVFEFLSEEEEKT